MPHPESCASSLASTDQLLRAVYPELRRLAHTLMHNERDGHTLQPTALVHETLLRLCGAEPVPYTSPEHFFRLAARQMRRLLTDHARRKAAARRGGQDQHVAWSEAVSPNAITNGESKEDLIALNLALDRLAEIDPRAVEVVELRFFAGLTAEEVARVLGVSLTTVERDWEFARLWLHAALCPAQPETLHPVK